MKFQKDFPIVEEPFKESAESYQQLLIDILFAPYQFVAEAFSLWLPKLHVSIFYLKIAAKCIKVFNNAVN